MNLPEKMQAVFYLAPGQIELREAAVPSPAPGELLVRVRVATTCGTDLKIYRRGHPKFPPPFIFGHEFGGEVAAVGEGVQNFQVGMRVTANVFAECGNCFYCRRGQGNLCEHLEYNFGAYAEYHRLPATIVRCATFEIPPQLTYAEAAVLEPLVTVVHAHRMIAVQPGETVAIIGAGGPIGLLHQQMALLAGAQRVIAIGHSAERLRVAAELGADPIVNSAEVSAEAAVRDLTEGRGADVVIECAGTAQAWQQAISLARRGGRVQWFGGLPAGTQVDVDATRVHYGSINLYNSHGGTAEDAREAMQLLADGRVKVRPLLSAELPLAETEQALQRMARGEAVKVVLLPPTSE